MANQKKGQNKERENKSDVTAEERFRMLQDAAYYLAEKDGFSKQPTFYWSEAEREIRTQLESRKGPE